jgi:putative transposase
MAGFLHNCLPITNVVNKHWCWQRCQTHFSRNMLDHTPKALQPEVKEELRRLYESIDLESVRKVRNQIIKTYESKAQKLQL